MVVSVSRPATEAGIATINRGGNAVDAAVAVAIALQVTWPEAGNIGGGGFMLLHPGPKKTPICIEYRETAPAAATVNMFKLDDSRHTCRVVGVPGTLRGLELAHVKYGRLPWAALFNPAIALADQGFEVDVELAKSLNKVLRDTPESFAEFRRVYAPPLGAEWKVGDILKQPDLAKTLQQLASFGAEDFYRGHVANLLVDEMRRCDGLITHADLMSYQAKIREPVQIEFNGYDIFGPPLPSSGGICLAEMFGALRKWKLAGDDRWSANSVHYRAELMKRVFLDRARHLGDSDFVPISYPLMQKVYTQQLGQSINLERATPSRELAPELFTKPESPSTTHFSVIDAAGMAVSNTYTLEQSYGSRIVVRGAGFLLNNEMGDFNWQPGLTDDQGHIGTPANVIAPGKRMLSSQTPVLVLKKGETILSTGSPGGRTIINTVFCVLMNVLQYNLDLPTAVAEPRFHHQWMPDKLHCEEELATRFPELIEELKRKGHDVVFSNSQGDAHSISRDPATGKLQGVADGRRGGFAQGD